MNQSQYQIEHAIYTLLPFGAEIKIAESIGKSAGLVSQYLNPNDDRVSPIFKAYQIFTALIEIDAEAGCKALQAFDSFVRRAIPGDPSLCVEATRRKAKVELLEADLAEVEGKSLDEQIKEHEESIEALKELVEAKKGSVREFASKAVEVREKVNGRPAA